MPVSGELGAGRRVHIKKRFSATEGPGHRRRDKFKKPRRRTPSGLTPAVRERTCPAARTDPTAPTSGRSGGARGGELDGERDGGCTACAFVISHCTAHAGFTFHCYVNFTPKSKQKDAPAELFGRRRADLCSFLWNARIKRGRLAGPTGRDRYHEKFLYEIFLDKK